MINLIGILSLIIVEAILIMAIIVYFSNKANKSDEEVAERDKELGERNAIIHKKNLIIKDLKSQNEELKNENIQLKRECNKRLR